MKYSYFVVRTQNSCFSWVFVPIRDFGKCRLMTICLYLKNSQSKKKLSSLWVPTAYDPIQPQYWVISSHKSNDRHYRKTTVAELFGEKKGFLLLGANAPGFGHNILESSHREGKDRFKNDFYHNWSGGRICNLYPMVDEDSQCLTLPSSVRYKPFVDAYSIRFKIGVF